MKKTFAAVASMWVMVIGMWIYSPEAAQSVEETTETEERTLEHYEWQPMVEAEEMEEEPETLKAYDDIPLSEEEQIYMQQICMENNISYEFALALMESESHFDAEAVGDKGESVGYFQINSINWPRMESEYGLNVHDPMDNIAAGILILREKFEKFEDPYQVIICYKAGDKRGTELYDQQKYKTDDYDCDAICSRSTELERSHGK